MNALIKFDYAQLDTETRIVVQQRTSEIKTLVRRSAQDLIDIGQKLTEVKERLGHGEFLPWIESEFGWSERTAQNFMQVADRFKSANFADLTVSASALYLLAAPSTPDDVRGQLIQRAAAGEPITYTTARAAVDAAKAPQRPITAEDVNVWLSSRSDTPRGLLLRYIPDRNSPYRRDLERHLNHRNIAYTTDTIEQAIAEALTATTSAITYTTAKGAVDAAKLTPLVPRPTPDDNNRLTPDFRAESTANGVHIVDHNTGEIVTPATSNTHTADNIAYHWLKNYTDHKGRTWQDLDYNQIIHANSPCKQAFIAAHPHIKPDAARAALTSAFQRLHSEDNRSADHNIDGKVSVLKKIIDTQPEAAETILDDLANRRHGWYHDLILTYTDDADPEIWQAVARRYITQYGQPTAPTIDTYTADGWQIIQNPDRTWQAIHPEDRIATPKRRSQDDLINLLQIGHHTADHYLAHTEPVFDAAPDRRAAKIEAATTLPVGTYNVIVADPPWQYNNTGVNGAAANHYPTMPLADLGSLLDDIGLDIAPNAVLFLWATNPMLADALDLINTWRFTYKTNLVWVKDRIGTGFYVRGMHELLLIATRGSFTPLEMGHTPPITSIISAPTQEHSRKPDAAYQIIEKLYPNCNYIELFARRPRTGWAVWGNEV